MIKPLAVIAMTMMGVFSTVASGQTHEHHHSDSIGMSDTVSVDTSHTHHMHSMDAASHAMSAITSQSLPMTRNGSGTGWQPDASPMYAYMYHDIGSGWHMMLHGSLFLEHSWVNVNHESKRSAQAFVVPSFFMAMVQRRIGGSGLLGIEAMFSLDPLTMGGGGYPLLLQTGETWQGKPLVDRQHPHDFFATLAVLYTHKVSDNIDVTAYVGYPGEPALGPTAFMHRASSIANPDAPLGHHWLDATHIVYGVSTLGVRIGNVKIEGSIFTGKEPDEDRFRFDKPLFDSQSWRLSWAPTRNIVAQVSQGYLTAPESHLPVNVTRTTASVQVAGGRSDAWWSGIVAGGLNSAGHDHNELALLAEAAIDLSGSIPFIRAEWVQKTTDELNIESLGDHTNTVNIGSLGVGVAQRLFTCFGSDVSVGTKLTVNVVSSQLEPYYGTMPISALFYLRLTPSLL